MINEDEIVSIPEFETTKLGTVRRFSSDLFTAYDLPGVLGLLRNKETNGLGEDLAGIDAENLLLKKYDVNENGPVFIVPFNTIEDAANIYGDFLVPNGFENAFVGVALKKDQPVIGVFSYEKCVEIMMDGMEEDEDPRLTTIEYLEYNTLGAWVGDQTPFFLENEEVE